MVNNCPCKRFAKTIIKVAISLGLIALASFLLAKVVAAAIDYPDYKDYVNDFTGKTVSKEFLDTQNKKLKEYDEKTTNQIAVAIIDSTGDEEIEQYSIHLAEKWKPGQKGKDNGILMTFAMNDRKMRIEVGRGLEGDVTDLESKIIIDDHIVPHFKQNNYEKGIEAGIDQVILSIATDAAALAQTQSSDTSSGVVIAIVIIILVVFVILLVIAESPYTPLGGSGSWGISKTWGSSSSSGGTKFGGGSFSGGGSSGGW